MRVLILQKPILLLHTKRVFNSVPCGRDKVFSSARQMDAGDVGKADALVGRGWCRDGGEGVGSRSRRGGAVVR
jgi:hypothetical protein